MSAPSKKHLISLYWSFFSSYNSFNFVRKFLSSYVDVFSKYVNPMSYTVNVASVLSSTHVV